MMRPMTVIDDSKYELDCANGLAIPSSFWRANEVPGTIAENSASTTLGSEMRLP
jgi:hypothetical protein